MASNPIVYYFVHPDDAPQDSLVRTDQSANSRYFLEQLNNKIFEGFDGLTFWLRGLMEDYATRRGKIDGLSEWDRKPVEFYYDWIETTKLLCRDYPGVCKWLDDWAAEHLADKSKCGGLGAVTMINNSVAEGTAEFDSIRTDNDIPPYLAVKAVADVLHEWHNKFIETQTLLSCAEGVEKKQRANVANFCQVSYVDEVGKAMIRYGGVILSNTRERLDHKLSMSPEVADLYKALLTAKGDVESLTIEYFNIQRVSEMLDGWLVMFAEYDQVKPRNNPEDRCSFSIDKTRLCKLFSNSFRLNLGNGKSFFDRFVDDLPGLLGDGSPRRAVMIAAYLAYDQSFAFESYLSPHWVTTIDGGRGFKPFALEFLACVGVEPGRFNDFSCHHLTTRGGKMYDSIKSQLTYLTRRQRPEV